MSEQRWCLIQDDSGHTYVCPAERAKEGRRMFEEIERYYYGEESKYQGDPPREPDFCFRVEGGLTFADPAEGDTHYVHMLPGARSPR